MKVTFSKSGGQLPGLRRPPAIVDGSTLPPEDAQTLAELVRAVVAEPSAAEQGPGQMRDAVTYKITVDDDGRTTVLTARDGSLPPKFVALRNWIESHARG